MLRNAKSIQEDSCRLQKYASQTLPEEKHYPEGCVQQKKPRLLKDQVLQLLTEARGLRSLWIVIPTSAILWNILQSQNSSRVHQSTGSTPFA